MNYLKQRLSQDKKKYIKILVTFGVILLFSLRIIGLDKDLPNFGIGLYQSKDEGNYSEMAIAYDRYGNFVGTSKMPIEISSIFRTNIIGNALQIVSMKIFGNNYYGFRIVYTMISLCTVFFIYLIINCLARKYELSDRYRKKLQVITLSFLLIYFPFLMMGRVVENSCLRAFSTCLFLYLLVEDRIKDEIRYFGLTFFSVLSWAFIYFSNIHLLITCGVLFISILLSGWNKCNKIKLAYMIRGAICGIIIAETYYIKVWGSGLFWNFFDSINRFSTRIVISGEEGGLIKKLSNGFMTFWGSNMFFYCIPLAIITVISVAICFYMFREKKDDFIICNITIILTVILQSIFINDWNERKAIVIFPSIMIGFIFVVLWIKKDLVNIKTMSLWSKLIILFLAFGLGVLSFVFGNYIREQKGYLLDFDGIDLLIIRISCIIQILLAAIAVIGMFFNIITFHIEKKTLIALGAIILATNLFFCTKYVYFYNHYTEKQVMIDIGKDIGDAYILGPYAYGYCLYNQIKPLGFIPKYAKNKNVNYFLDYSAGPYYLNQAKLKKSFILFDTYHRGLQASGDYYNIGVYKKADK